jgi:hypothetical protein
MAIESRCAASCFQPPRGINKSLAQRKCEQVGKDIDAMKAGYPYFQLYTWIEEKQIWITEEGQSKQLRRIPQSVRSDLKRGKCRVFSDLNGNDCYAKVENTAHSHSHRGWLEILDVR